MRRLWRLRRLIGSWVTLLALCGALVADLVRHERVAQAFLAVAIAVLTLDSIFAERSK